jgi:hypothetical protein
LNYFNHVHARLGLRLNFPSFLNDEGRQDISKGLNTYAAIGVGVHNSAAKILTPGLTGKVGLEYMTDGIGIGVYYGGTGFADLYNATSQ